MTTTEQRDARYASELLLLNQAARALDEPRVYLPLATEGGSILVIDETSFRTGWQEAGRRSAAGAALNRLGHTAR